MGQDPAQPPGQWLFVDLTPHDCPILAVLSSWQEVRACVPSYHKLRALTSSSVSMRSLAVGVKPMRNGSCPKVKLSSGVLSYTVELGTQVHERKARVETHEDPRTKDLSELDH